MPWSWKLEKKKERERWKKTFYKITTHDKNRILYTIHYTLHTLHYTIWNNAKTAQMQSVNDSTLYQCTLWIPFRRCVCLTKYLYVRIHMRPAYWNVLSLPTSKLQKLRILTSSVLICPKWYTFSTFTLSKIPN